MMQDPVLRIVVVVSRVHCALKVRPNLFLVLKATLSKLAALYCRGVVDLLQIVTHMWILSHLSVAV